MNAIERAIEELKKTMPLVCDEPKVFVTRALTALQSHAEQVQQLTAENERLEECRKHWREAEATRMQDCIQANAERDAALAEVAKLKDVIRQHIKWWYEPRNYADHSEGAYNKLRTALTESEAKDVSTQA